MVEICEVEKGSVVESITNFSVGFHSLSLLGSMQVAKAPRCAQSCSVLSVPAKEELLPLHLCLCVCVCVYVWGGGDEDFRMYSTAVRYDLRI